MSDARASQSLASIAESLEHLPDSPTTTSRGREWRGVTLDIHSVIPNFDMDAPALDHHVLAYCPMGAGKLLQRRAGKTHESVIRTGSLIIMPGGLECSWRGVAAASIRMRVPMQLMDDAANETGRRPNRGAELLNVFHTRDLLVGHLSTIFAAELDRPAHPAQVLLVSAASCALAAHLLRSYDAFGEKEVKIHGLGPRALSDVISYIEDNIEATITLESLAKLAHVSRFHFARLFKVSTDLTPMAFVEQARIRRAQALMMDSNLALSEIAIAVGFVDQSHFTRRFRLHAGCTPTEYAHSRGLRGLSGRKTSNLFDPIRTSTS